MVTFAKRQSDARSVWSAWSLLPLSNHHTASNGASKLHVTHTIREAVLPKQLLLSVVLSFVSLCSADETSKLALKYEEPKSLSGTIYSADRKKALFKFTRRCTRIGSTLTVLREYSDMGGTPALREKVIYQGDDLAEYDLDELQIGAKGGARIAPAEREPDKKTITYEYAKDVSARNKPKTRSEPLRPGYLISDMVAPFLMEHWTALLKGTEIKCRYIVVERRETVGFTFVKESEERRGGGSVIIVKMFPTSPIISALVDPLVFTIEKEGKRRVLEYAGRTPLRLRQGKKWKDLDGVTVFDW